MYENQNSHLKPDTYAEPSQKFKMEFFAKIVKSYNYFSKGLQSLSKYSLTFRVTKHYVLHDTYSEPCLVLKIQTYSGIFTSCSDIFSHIVAYLEPCVIIAYSEPFHVQNPGIFRIQDIFRTLSKHILAYLVGCLTLTF